MKITKIFITTNAEKKLLEQKAAAGFALIKRQGFSYIFEKTDCDIKYRYVFLKNGRKSFIELKDKNRDPDCRLVYGNSDLALFCKDGQKPGIMSSAELRTNYLKRRQKCITAYLCLIALGCAAASVARVLSPLWLIAGGCFAAAVFYFLESRGIDKMIKEL